MSVKLDYFPHFIDRPVRVLLIESCYVRQVFSGEIGRLAQKQKSSEILKGYQSVVVCVDLIKLVLGLLWIDCFIHCYEHVSELSHVDLFFVECTECLFEQQ